MTNLATKLWRTAAQFPDKVALIFNECATTFAELRDQVAHAAAGLEDAGFRLGDKLAIMLPTCPEVVIFEFAAFSLGGTVLPLNVHYRTAEVEHLIGGCEADFLIIHRSFTLQLANGVLQRLPRLRRVFVLSETDTDVQTAIHEDTDDRIASATEILNHAGSLTQTVDCVSETLAFMLHTSATTGKAKGVMLSIGNIEANYDRTPAWLGLSHNDRILCALPLYNTFGLNQCINAMMVTGATLILLPRFDVVEVLRAMQNHHATFFPAVPTMLQKLLNHPQARQYDITSVKRFLLGAAPVPAPLVESVYEAVGRDAIVMTGYGLTEASALVSLDQTALDSDGNLLRPKSVGRPLPGIEMKVVDDAGSELPNGVVGQIVIRGPNIMQGYYRQPDETAAAVIDGWLQTGDLAVTDADGYFYVVDRKKDLIIRGGQNIYPADIEEQLYSHPAVAEAAAVGRADEVFGEVPEAYVALKPGRVTTSEELMNLCKSELAYFKVPKHIFILNELPKGPTGKILRRELRPQVDRQ